jgi:hypothetical protein
MRKWFLKLFWLLINKKFLLASLKTLTHSNESFSSLPLIDFLISSSAIGQFSPVNIPQPAFGTNFQGAVGRASEEGY